VHTHNVHTNLSGLLEYRYEPTPIPEIAPMQGSFMGYLRPDGRVGVRNEIWIVNTVGCVNKTAERLAALANERWGGQVDGIHAFVHPYGCSQLGEDHANTQKLLSRMVHHPNAGGVLVLGLGCENNNIPVFKEVLGETDPARVKFPVLATARKTFNLRSSIIAKGLFHNQGTKVLLIGDNSFGEK
jgi:altronate hydrolase